MKEIPITDISGIRIGHFHDLDAATGCTVVLCEQGAAAGVDVRGGAPGTRETDLLRPGKLVEAIHAVVLAGGSAFGLDAASGVMNWLEERGRGFDVGVTTVPIVCGAVLFDLLVGDHKVRPDRNMGYRACENAGSSDPLEGCVGAGAGACVGKLMGMETAMKTGVGCYCIQEKNLKVGAIVAVNCLGDIHDPDTGQWIAGMLDAGGKTPARTEKVMAANFTEGSDLFGGNITLGVIVTNAALAKPQAMMVASMAHNGYARAMRPSHSMYDGDTIFAIATGEVQADVSVTGMMAALAMGRAIVRAATTATGMHGLTSHRDITGQGA